MAPVVAVSSSGKDRYLVLGTSRGLLFLADLQTEGLVQLSRRRSSVAVTTVAAKRLNDDNHYLLAIGSESRLEILAVKTDDNLLVLETRQLVDWHLEEPVGQVAWSQQGEDLLYSAGATLYRQGYTYCIILYWLLPLSQEDRHPQGAVKSTDFLFFLKLNRYFK
jgi:WD40 repeat protein